jgi:hypothetical protein
MGQCQFCKKEVDIPFVCSYCGQSFCSEHRLPENHLCPALQKFKDGKWKDYKELKKNPEKQQNQPKLKKPKKPKQKTLTQKISNRITGVRRKYVSKYQYRKLKRKTKTLIIISIQVSIITVLSLPLYLAYMVDAQTDPLTTAFLGDLITERVFIPAGIYTASLLYLIYRKLSNYRLKFEWVLLFSTSFGASWYIVRFLSMMASINMIFTNNPLEIPNLLFFYREWTILLINIIKTSIKYLTIQINQHYKQLTDYLISLKPNST